MMNTPLRPSPASTGSPASAVRADLLIGLVDDLGMGYVRFNRQARLEQVNDLFAAWSQTPGELLRGTPLSEYLSGPPHAQDADADRFLDPSIHGNRLELRTPAGVLPVRVVARPVEDENGQLAGGFWLLQDLRQETELTQVQRESLRLRALGALTAGIAHDFNNILTTVLGQTEMLEIRHGKELSDDARQRLGRIERSGRQAAGLVSQMLTFARQRIEQKAQIDLGSVISSAIEVLRHGLPEDIHLRKDLRTPQRIVWGSLTQLQVAVVLMSLSVQKEMRQGGTIVLRLEQSPYNDYHGWLQLTVADAATDDLAETGSIPPPVTLEPGSEFSEVLATHGGSLHMISPLCYLCLLPPFSPNEDEKDALVSSASLDRLKGHGRILLVEDDSAVAETTAQMLRSLGYEVVTAVLPSQALHLMRTQPRNFDLMVSDITMPEMNGYQLADEICRQFGYLPVLFVTGYDFNVSSGSTARVLLQKPLTLQRLGEGVRQVLKTTASRS